MSDMEQDPKRAEGEASEPVQEAESKDAETKSVSPPPTNVGRPSMWGRVLRWSRLDRR